MFGSTIGGPIRYWVSIVVEARTAGLAGATVHRGIMGFGGNSTEYTLQKFYVYLKTFLL